MSGPADVAGDQLRTIVERIEQVEEEIRELTEAKKEIFFEAKGKGFDVKVLREVILTIHQFLQTDQSLGKPQRFCRQV
jgi:uncharacterized protein (UPF0335 family)